MKKSIHITSTGGCTENLIDGAVLARIARQASYTLTEDPSRADLIVVNTCAFKKSREKHALATIQSMLRSKKADARVVVCGCLVKINPQALEQVFDGPTFAPTELDQFYELVERPHATAGEESIIPPEVLESQSLLRRLTERIYEIKHWSAHRLGRELFPAFDIHDFVGDTRTVHVRMARGCPRSCGYCAVRFAQGPLVSRPLDDILRTIRDALNEGYQTFFLTATNLGAYGRDRGTTFLDAMSEILNIDGDFQVILQNVEPFGLMDQTDGAVKVLSSNRIRSLYVPLNSGSQRVLDRMNRPYRIDRVLKLLATIRNHNPQIKLRSEFLVGYPGETRDDFRKSLDVIRTFPFDMVDVHAFSPRPGIPANRQDGHVPRIQRAARYCRAASLVGTRTLLPKLRPL